ncbi:GNAT family N-acetyltransferase [Bacteroides sp.]
MTFAAQDLQLNIVRYTAEQKTAWDSFVAASKNGTFLFMRDYMDYHADRFIDHSLMFYKGGRIIALLPGNITGDTYYTHGGLTYGGFILSHHATATIVLEAFYLLCRYLKETVGMNKIVYRTVPFIYHNYPSGEDLYALFRLNARLTERKISSVVMPEGGCSFNTLRRRKLKLARKNGLKVCQDEAFDVFWAVLEHNLQQRHGRLPVHSMDEIIRLNRHFPEEIKLYRVLDGEEMLGGCVMYLSGEVAHVQYIASTEQGREMGALDILFDELIHQIYVDKRYFDFGVSTEDGGRYLNEGLIFQKEGFGGRAVMYDTYELYLDSAIDD